MGADKAPERTKIDKLYHRAKNNYLDIILGSGNHATQFDQEIESLGISSKIRIGKKEYLSFTTNDYLGLSTNIDVKRACVSALEEYGNGTCGARVSGGTTPLHKQLERCLAEFTGEESAVLFNTGYMANLALSDILSKDDVFICDRLDHASIFDGVRLCGAKLLRFKHNDLAHLERILKSTKDVKNRVVFVESIYSMDGDISPLPDIIDLAKAYKSYVFLDEAHSIGVLGKTGRGALEHFGIDSAGIELRMGTLSKSAGAIGGFIFGKKTNCEIVRYNSRQYIFSASLPTSVVAGALEAFKIIAKRPDRVRDYQKKYLEFASRLRSKGFDLGNSQSQIIPIIIGDERKTCEAHDLLLESGIYVTSVIYPVVPKNEARLRIGITASHSEEDLDCLYNALVEADKKLSLI